MSEEENVATTNVTVMEFWERMRKVVEYHDYHFKTTRWRDEVFEQKVEQMNEAAQQFDLPTLSVQECDTMLARLNDMCIIDLKMKLTRYMSRPQSHQPESLKDVVARQRNFY